MNHIAKLFLIHDPCFNALIFRVNRKFAASQNFPGRREIVADRPSGTIPTSEEHLAIKFVGSARTAPFGWCGYAVFKIWWAISEGDWPWFELCRSLNMRSSTIWNPGIIFASLGTLSPAMGTFIDVPAHRCTRNLIFGGRELRWGQPDAMDYDGLRNDREHPILKNSTEVNPNRVIQAIFREIVY